MGYYVVFPPKAQPHNEHICAISQFFGRAVAFDLMNEKETIKYRYNCLEKWEMYDNHI